MSIYIWANALSLGLGHLHPCLSPFPVAREIGRQCLMGLSDTMLAIGEACKFEKTGLLRPR